MCAQTRPRFILSPERVLVEWSQDDNNNDDNDNMTTIIMMMKMIIKIMMMTTTMMMVVVMVMNMMMIIMMRRRKRRRRRMLLQRCNTGCTRFSHEVRRDSLAVDTDKNETPFSFGLLIN